MCTCSRWPGAVAGQRGTWSIRLTLVIALWEVERLRVARPSDFIREARSPDVCKNPWSLNVNIKSKVK